MLRSVREWISTRFCEDKTLIAAISCNDQVLFKGGVMMSRKGMRRRLMRRMGDERGEVIMGRWTEDK